MVDRCTRWHAAEVIESKQDVVLMKAIDTWVRLHGPMRELIMDCESGVAKSSTTQEYLKRHGIKFVPRAPSQHARVIERRGALLRDTIHRIDEQLKAEGIDIPFDFRLSEAVFAGNALITINNTTPYNAVYGRVPRLLPNLDAMDSEMPDVKPVAGLIRESHILREISIQSTFEGTARAILGRALNARTRPAGEREGYHVGYEVDFYRPAHNKDTSGWVGPATIADVSRLKRGNITVRHLNQLIEVKLGDVRRHLHFLVLSQAVHGVFMSFDNAWA